MKRIPFTRATPVVLLAVGTLLGGVIEARPQDRNQEKIRPNVAKRSRNSAPIVVDEKRFEEVPTEGDWLLIGELDAGGRRPLSTNVVLATYGMGRELIGPSAGDELTGELGVERAWLTVERDGDGELALPGGETVGAGYTTIEAPHDGVCMLRLAGASTVTVNWRSYAADLYRYGFEGFPIELKKGTNHVFVHGIRGSFTFELSVPEKPHFFATWDMTLGDLLRDKLSMIPIGVPMVNASLSEQDVWIYVGEEEDPYVTRQFAMQYRLMPSHVNYFPMAVVPEAFNADRFEGVDSITFPITAESEEGEVLASTVLTLRVKDSSDRHVKSFISIEDNSVQKVAIVPHSNVLVQSPGMLVTLHGAGVDCEAQANCYPQYDDVMVVAPTNRRPYGFDWQDWGKTNIHRTIAPLGQAYNADRSRMYLTGHSMGGHGVWHMAANDTDLWTAIAPCAGWRSFDTYGSRPDGVLSHAWRGADFASETEELLANVRQLPAYIYHGEADETVPAAEAKAMAQHLEKLGTEHVLHLVPGEGHWFDDPATPFTDCVAAPELTEFLFSKRRELAPRAIEHTFTHQSVDSTHHWFHLTQKEHYGQPSKVKATLDPETETIHFELENVRRFAIRPPATEAEVFSFSDGSVVAAKKGRREVPFMKGPSGGWEEAPVLSYQEKRADKCGPIKRGWGRKFIVVLPTRGRAEEIRATRDRFLFDASMWAYRGNGVAHAITDKEFLEQVDNPKYGYNNIVLYGNAMTNLAYNKLVPPGPIRMNAGSLTVNGTRIRGGLTIGLFATRRLDSDAGIVLVQGSTGPFADRLAPVVNQFVSGAGFPDFLLATSDVLLKGDDGVLTTGWFTHHWHIQEN